MKLDEAIEYRRTRSRLISTRVSTVASGSFEGKIERYTSGRVAGPPGDAREKQLHVVGATRLNAGPYTRLRSARITRAFNLNLLKNIAQTFGVDPRP